MQCLVFVVEAFEAEIDCAGAQLFLNAEKLVVLGDAVGTAGGGGPNLVDAGGDGDIVAK
jgi:hypothetical protein